MNESEKKSIEDRVDNLLRNIKLAQAASDLDDDLGEVDFFPISALHIENFGLFPYDYQYFMTNIGQLFISFSGYTSFMLSIPKLCILDDPDWDDPYTIFDDDLTLIWCDKDADCENLKFLASAPNNYESLAVDERDYSFIETYGMETVGFLDFVERHMDVLDEFTYPHITNNNNDDKSLVLRCVSERGLLLGRASARLRDDLEVVRAAIKNSNGAYKFASHRLQRKKSIAILALEESFQYERLDPALREDREIAFIAVSLDGRNLKFVGSDLRADKEIVAAAISSNPEARQYALLDL